MPLAAAMPRRPLRHHRRLVMAQPRRPPRLVRPALRGLARASLGSAAGQSHRRQGQAVVCRLNLGVGDSRARGHEDWHFSIRNEPACAAAGRGSAPRPGCARRSSNRSARSTQRSPRRAAPQRRYPSGRGARAESARLGDEYPADALGSQRERDQGGLPGARRCD